MICNVMNSEVRERRIKIIILLLVTVSSIIYLISLKIAYPLFQATRLNDPLAELHSLFPLYYIAIGIMALAGSACFIFRVNSRGTYILILILLAIMLWYTPYILAEYTWEPDGPRNMGVSLQITQIMRGLTFPSSPYGLDFPLAHILDYTLMLATGLDHLIYLHLLPLICIFIFTLLCYRFAFNLLSNPLTAFIATLLAMIGMHYVFFTMGAHVIGVLLLLTVMALLWQKDIASRVLAFVLIVAVIICHPISPLILGGFLAAALVSNLSRRQIRSQLVVAIMLFVCMVGWFIWPTLSLVPTKAPGLVTMPQWAATGESIMVPATYPPDDGIKTATTAKEPQGVDEWASGLQHKIFPDEFKTTERFLLGNAFIYKGIYNTNKAIYIWYALLALAGVGFIFYRTYLRQKRFRHFLYELGGLSRAELFMIISIPILLVLTILLGESTHVLMERGLTFIILVISVLIASILNRIYEPSVLFTRRIIGGALVITLLVLTLLFPVISHSIAAYNSLPISEEAGLKFMANYAPLDTNKLATSSAGQIILYRPFVEPPINLKNPSSLTLGDVFAFRKTGYYYAALRHELSFEDNWFTRYLSAVKNSSEFNSIYFNPTTSVFMRIR